jgi:hypothetical protein
MTDELDRMIFLHIRPGLGPQVATNRNDKYETLGEIRGPKHIEIPGNKGILRQAHEEERCLGLGKGFRVP